MPQGRRKTPFSGKAKKEQLKAKKQGQGRSYQQGSKRVLLAERSSNDDSGDDILKVNSQPNARGKRRNANKYALKFRKETDAELKILKEAAYQELIPATEADLEINADDYFCDELDFPTRPPWNFEMSSEQLEAKEQRYFHEYIKKIESLSCWDQMGYLELNLETWRQLWRVLEMSDILLFIVDIRFPAAMFPPSLYKYVTETVNKNMILVLNKIDLAPASLVVAWYHYFKTKYPELHILMFTTIPGYNLRGNTTDKGGLQTRRRKGKVRMAAEGAQQLLEICKSIVDNQVDLNSWQRKIDEEKSLNYDSVEVEISENIMVKNDTSFVKHERFNGGILTIGCVGQPNVGKSSLMNALMGKKVVSVSRTPGHTKHFQTIFLTPNVRLCDCPGLVFPSKVSKNLQVLMGTFPIAQLRQPYGAVGYIAVRMDLKSALRIQHPEGDDRWSTMDICEAWAKKKGYLTAKAARPDTYRAANSLLRMQLEGKICVCLCPPGYTTQKEMWESHRDVETVHWIQANTNEGSEEATASSIITDSSDDDEPSSYENKSSPVPSSDDEPAFNMNPYSALANDA